MGVGAAELPLPADRVAAYRGAIERLPPGRLLPADVLSEDLVIWSEWDIDCHYAPLDAVERDARIVLVAINPGLNQVLEAYAAARDRLWAGAGWEAASVSAKRAAAVIGPQATNLARMLDSLQIPARLAAAGGRPATASRALLGDPSGTVHLTYCVRYPVRVQHRDYTGRRPVLLRAPRLREFAFELLAAELDAMPAALVIPLGRIAGDVLVALAAEGRLRLERCLFGLPHPSGANGHREGDFGRARARMEMQLDAWFGAPAGARPDQTSLNTIG
jgi:hypothetical protein